MTEAFSSHEENTFEPQAERYRKIDEANKKSFLMNEVDSLRVIQSLHSAGGRRDALTPAFIEENPGALSLDVIAEAQRVGRTLLAGNMSPLNRYGPTEMSEDERKIDAKKNIDTFFYAQNINPANVRILHPEREYSTPLTVIDLDEVSFTLDDVGLLRSDIAGDLMYTHNMDIIPAARPADCPVVFVAAETPSGPITALLHLAWEGVANGYVAQAEKALTDLGVEWQTVRAQITPGGHAETYTFTNFTKFNPLEKFPGSETLFIGVEEVGTRDGLPAYNFAIDVAAEVYEQVTKRWPIDPYQVFLDTSDTTSPTTGYSSHSRSHKGYAIGGENTRDIVLATH